jgi:hypothetical protein
MAVMQRREREEDSADAAGTAIDAEKQGGGGGWFATAFSAVAVGLSCISVYVSTLQGAHIEVYVPPTIHYGRASAGDIELFAIPVTIANNGARSATVLSIEIDVENLKTKMVKRFYSAFLGEHPRESTTPNRQFAPVSIAGRAVFTDTVRFYPVGGDLTKLVTEEGGEYSFRLKLNVAAPSQPSLLDRLQGRVQPAPIVFQMTLPFMSDQLVGMRRGVIIMHAKDWKPTAGSGG